MVMLTTVSEKTDELIPALLAVQKELPRVEKDKENPHLKNSYASLDQILEVLRPLLNSHGFILVQPVDEGSVQTILMHQSGQWISGRCQLPEAGTKGASGAQAMGSAITYARRYSLQSIIGVTFETDDDGGAASKRALDPTLVTRLKELAPYVGGLGEKQLAFLVSAAAADIGESNAKRIIAALEDIKESGNET